MDELICQIIEKVRRMYKYTPEYGDVVNQRAQVVLEEKDDSKIVLSHIAFRWYDSIYVYSNHIEYHPEHGNHRTLIAYRDFYQLLEL